MEKEMTYLEACEIHKELETKLNDVNCDFSNYERKFNLFMNKWSIV